MSYEKDQFAVAGENSSGGYDNERKASHIGEAADLYGDVATAEEYGYVERGLKSRHIQFIALGGTIGTGLFLGIGGALYKYGPLSIFLGYSITGFAVYGMMMCLGEMSTYLPLPGAIPQYCARYVDPAMGFAVGWNHWYSCAITLCVEISAAAVLIAYWEGAADINPAAWITLVIVLVICLNIFAVAIYGEAEFIFASIKLITIVGLLLLSFILFLGGANDKGRLGFHYWKDPGAMTETVGTGNWGRFLSFFSTLINAAFSYGGVEMVAIAAGEAEDPKRNIPKAVRRVFWRILFFYVLGSLAIGVNVPYTDKDLNADSGDGKSSPWVIAIQRAGIDVLPSIVNAVILTSATSSANAFLYTGSRYMFGIAQNGQAPRFLLKCSKRGIPYYCVAMTAAVSLLTYLCVSTDATVVFNWFANLTTIAQLFTWCSICIAYIRFHKGLAAQGISRDSLDFKSPLQPYAAWVALIFFAVIILFNGWEVFTEPTPWTNENVQSFVIAYVGMPIYFTLYVGWKLVKRTKVVKLHEMDLHTGKAALDAQVWPERLPRNIWERIWFWIA